MSRIPFAEPSRKKKGDMDNASEKNMVGNLSVMHKIYLTDGRHFALE